MTAFIHNAQNAACTALMGMFRSNGIETTPTPEGV